MSDLNIAVEANMATMRAVGRDKVDGKVYVYSFNRPPKGWPAYIGLEAIRAEEEVGERLDRLVLRGDLSLAQARHSRPHERWKVLQGKVDIGYRREELKS